MLRLLSITFTKPSKQSGWFQNKVFTNILQNFFLKTLKDFWENIPGRVHSLSFFFA